MDRIPFGVGQLDSIIEGGAPPGSVVLVAGEAGAGTREFLYTCAVMNGLAGIDHELFDLHYGDLPPNAALPEAVHYISFTASEEQLRRDVAMSMDDEIAEPGIEEVRFASLSHQFFHVSPVPRNWYARETDDIENLRKRHEEREDLLTALGDELDSRAPGNVVVIDSLSDLIGAIGDHIDWSDVGYLVTGLQRAASEWGGLILLHLNHQTVTSERYGQFTDTCSGTMEFNWEAGGSTRARTLVVKQFRGVLSQLEDEDIVKFETELGETGFDISDVRKIR
jgi:archaellum biogenesis ATPase FlaH